MISIHPKEQQNAMLHLNYREMLNAGDASVESNHLKC